MANTKTTNETLTKSNAKIGRHIVRTAFPEWGNWYLGKDRNGWVISASQGSRMLDEGEFSFWHIVPNEK